MLSDPQGHIWRYSFAVALKMPVSDRQAGNRYMELYRLGECELVAGDAPWVFASENAEAIAANWSSALAANPKLFDGDVFVVERWGLERGKLHGRSLRAKFSAYLYWRDAGAGVGLYSEAFATTVIVAGDGGVLLAKAVAGTLNAGRYASPGGLLDERDVGAGGRLDPAAAAGRELLEETGLDCAAMQRDPGFLMAHVAPYLAIASVFRSRLSGAELVGKVQAFLAGEDDPELEDPRMIYDRAALCELPLTPFARLLSEAVLA